MLADVCCWIADGGSRLQCAHCEKWIHASSMTRHIRNQHQTLDTTSACSYCSAVYKNQAVLSNHLRLKHNIFSNK